jgi:hypothetical protein
MDDMSPTGSRSGGAMALAHCWTPLALMSWGYCATATISCSASRPATTEAEFSASIVTPPCADAHPPIQLEFVRVTTDSQPRKPSRDVRHYLVDVLIARKETMSLWLLVDEDTFPSAVNSVRSGDDEARPLELEQAEPPRAWWFSGNDTVRAWPLGGAPKTSLTNIAVGTGKPRIPVTLGTIELDGESPQQWARRMNGRQPWHTRGEPPARGTFDAFCTTWVDLEALAREHQSTATTP